METIPPSEETVTLKRTHFYPILVVLAFAVGILTGYIRWGRPSEQDRAAAGSRDTTQTTVARWQALARQKVVELDALIARAQRMKYVLETGLHCGCLRLEDCPIVPGDVCCCG